MNHTAGGPGRLGPGQGILESPAVARGDPQALGRKQKRIRRRLADAQFRIIAKHPLADDSQPRVGGTFTLDRVPATAGNQGHGHLQVPEALQQTARTRHGSSPPQQPLGDWLLHGQQFGGGGHSLARLSNPGAHLIDVVTAAPPPQTHQLSGGQQQAKTSRSLAPGPGVVGLGIKEQPI